MTNPLLEYIRLNDVYDISQYENYYGKQDDNGYTALMLIMRKPYIDINVIKILIKHEIKLCSNNGCTALMHYVMNHTHLDNKIITLLHKELGMCDVNGYTAALHAIQNKCDNIEVLSQEFNVRDNNGNTLLHKYLEYGNDESIIKLLSSLTNVPNNYKVYPVMIYLKYNDILPDDMFDIDVKDIYNNTPLHWYMRHRRNPILSTVTKLFNTDINMCGESGLSLYMAKRSPKLSIVRMFNQLYNHKYYLGNTALMIHVLNTIPNVDIVKELESELYIKNDLGMTPNDVLHFAK